MCVCACVCVRACVRAFVRALRACACVRESLVPVRLHQVAPVKEVLSRRAIVPVHIFDANVVLPDALGLEGRYMGLPTRIVAVFSVHDSHHASWRQALRIEVRLFFFFSFFSLNLKT